MPRTTTPAEVNFLGSLVRKTSISVDELSVTLSSWFLNELSIQRFHNVFAYGCPDMGRDLTKSQIKSFSKDCIIYAINIEPSSRRDGYFEGNFLQLWKPCEYIDMTHSTRVGA